MAGVDWLLTVGSAVLLLVVGYGVVGSAGRRDWATQSSGRSWTRWLGVLGAILVAVAAGLFSVWPPGGVYVLAVAGVLAYFAGLFATAGAAGLAASAVTASDSYARQLRVFWYAAAVYFRSTRAAFVLSVLAFGLAAVVAGVTVDQMVSAVGAAALGGVFASLLSLAFVGVFVPGGYDETIAQAVRGAR
jgi:hypothetical protein